VHATFVENDYKVIAILKRNLAQLGLLSDASVHQAEAARWVELHPGEVGKTDIVFLDPPYRDPVLGEVLVALDAAARGTVVVEWSGKEKLPELANLEVRRDKAYGATRLTILTPR
jgi:16S rRNA G966 N2-methylase RsmD